MNDLLISLLPALGTGLVGWFVGRGKSRAETRKIHAEAQSIEIANVEKISRVWREANDQLVGEINRMKEVIADQTRKIEALEKRVQALTCENTKLRKLIEGDK